MSQPYAKNQKDGERQVTLMAKSTVLSISDHFVPLGARSTGYEAIHMIRKGQASGSASAPGIGLLLRFILGLFAATS